MEKILLASSSPRRKRLLGLLLEEFDTHSPDIDELLNSPSRGALIRLAEQKAQTCLYGGTVIAADTVLMLEGELLTKPDNRDHAVTMLSRLSDSSPEVLTAVAVLTPDNRIFSEIVTTRLHMRSLEKHEILRYVATGAADDKAGALEVQARAAEFVKSIDGCKANVFGLPLCATSRLLINGGVKVAPYDLHNCCTRDDLEEYLRDES